MTQAKPSGCAFTDYTQPQMINVADMGEHELLNWRIGKVKDKLFKFGLTLDVTFSIYSYFYHLNANITLEVDFFRESLYTTIKNKNNGQVIAIDKIPYDSAWDTDLIKYVEDKINEYSK